MRVALNARIKASSIHTSRRIFLQSVLATVAAARFAQPLSAAPLGIQGRAAPALRVPYWIDGNAEPMVFDAQSLRQRWVVLKFFQSWCPGCHSHGFPTMKTIADEFATHPQVRLLAVQTVFEGFSINTRNRLQEMQDRYDLRIPFGHDAGNPQGDHRPGTMREYRSGGTPWLVVVDPQRNVVFNDFRLSATRFIDWLTPQLEA
jgi:thiol-disulfide isomerase/thioredoxin